MAQNALNDSCMHTNCREATAAQIEELFAIAYMRDFEWR